MRRFIVKEDIISRFSSSSHLHVKYMDRPHMDVLSVVFDEISTNEPIWSEITCSIQTLHLLMLWFDVSLDHQLFVYLKIVKYISKGNHHPRHLVNILLIVILSMWIFYSRWRHHQHQLRGTISQSGIWRYDDINELIKSRCRTMSYEMISLDLAECFVHLVASSLESWKTIDNLSLVCQYALKCLRKSHPVGVSLMTISKLSSISKFSF